MISASLWFRYTNYGPFGHIFDLLVVAPVEAGVYKEEPPAFAVCLLPVIWEFRKIGHPNIVP